jgi:hypothetical protein
MKSDFGADVGALENKLVLSLGACTRKIKHGRSQRARGWRINEIQNKGLGDGR